MIARWVTSLATLFVLLIPAGSGAAVPNDAEFLLTDGRWGPPQSGRIIRAEAASMTVSLPDGLPAWLWEDAEDLGDYWSSVCGAPDFQFVDERHSADVRVHFCYDDSGLPEGTRLRSHIAAFTVPLIDSLGTRILGADVWVNLRDFSLVDRCDPVRAPIGQEGVTLVVWKVLCLHELTHALGLGHASGQCNALMSKTVTYWTTRGRRSCLCIAEAADWDRRCMLHLYGRAK